MVLKIELSSSKRHNIVTHPFFFFKGTGYHHRRSIKKQYRILGNEKTITELDTINLTEVPAAPTSTC